MALKCICDNQDLLSFDIASAAEWEALRARNRKDKVLKMACCAAEVVLKTSKLGTQYFTHAHKSSCQSVPDTAEGLQAKVMVVAACRRAGWSSSVEASGQTAEGEPWSVDVLVNRGERTKVAFAIHWGRLPIEEARRRQAQYRAAGIRAMWLLGKNEFPADPALPTFRMSRNDATGAFFVSIPGTSCSPVAAAALSSAGKAGPKQPLRVELGRFIKGALAGKLQFAPHVGRQLPMDVWAAYTACWRCKKQTGLVISLCWAASRVLRGATDVSAKIYEFDAQEGDKEVGDKEEGVALLMAALPGTLLAAHGIGIVKPRYSRTEGRTYLSNGCVHCDALQGRFFDHQVWHEAQLAFSIDVLFDQRWTSHLEYREAIDQWWFDERAGEHETAPASQG